MVVPTNWDEAPLLATNLHLCCLCEWASVPSTVWTVGSMAAARTDRSINLWKCLWIQRSAVSGRWLASFLLLGQYTCSSCPNGLLYLLGLDCRRQILRLILVPKYVKSSCCRLTGWTISTPCSANCPDSFIEQTQVITSFLVNASTEQRI